MPTNYSSASTVLKASRDSSRRFDEQAVRAQLRPLVTDGLSVASGDELDYFAYYGLDFETRLNGVLHRFGSVAANGYQIATHCYEVPQARGSCVLQHGYFDHSGLFSSLIGYCLGKQMNVLIWDLPGHGLSSGPQASIDGFGEYADVFLTLLGKFGAYLPKPWYAIGQSTGAAILMKWMMRDCPQPAQSPFESIALLAPLVRPAGWRWLKFVYQMSRPFRRNGKRIFVDNSADRDFLELLRNDPMQSKILPVRWIGAMRAWIRFVREASVSEHSPVVIQGDSDDTVDWRWNTKMIARVFPSAEFVLVPGARHHLANESPPLRTQVFEALGLA